MRPDKIAALLQAAVASGTAAGLAAAVTDGTATIFEAASGTAYAGGQGVPIAPDTLFWIASMTKPLTSVAALQLVERGILALDTPVGTILPQLAHPQILEGGRLRPATRPILLRHLLTHTAGFAYSFTSAELAAWLRARGQPPGRALADLELPLLFEPGERWEYGISTDWLGLVVEAASGLPLDAYFAAHITGPLGMADTTFRPTPEQWARHAGLYRRLADGSLAETGQPFPDELDYCSGGGGLHSTLADYQKFCRCMLNGGAGLIAPKTFAGLATNQIGTLRAGYIPSADPSLPGGDFMPGIDARWTFGFLTNPTRGHFGRSAGSLAWAGIANTHFWIDPAQNLAGVLMMQVLPPTDLDAIRTYIQFEQAAYARPAGSAPAIPPI